MADKTFDVVVLGAGPGGYVAAIRAADLGGSVALIECGHVGGVCLNVGCIPTKALLHASETFHQIAAGGGELLGIRAPGVTFDLAAVVDAKDKTVARLRGGLNTVIGQRPSIARIAGYARLAGPGHVAVFDATDHSRQIDELSAKSIILATGGRPARPKAFPFSDRVVTTDEILSLRQQPARLLVVGGGVNGCEQATFFAEIGTQVTIVEALDRILPMMDEDVSREVAKNLKKRKVAIHAGRRSQP